MLCPCHSGKLYSECCGPYHEGAAAPTPVALMRSRYSAYALKNADYIIASTHPNLIASVRSREEILAYCAETSFDGLDILLEKGDQVTFKAHLTRAGADASFSEKSRFVKLDGRWMYYSGVLQQE